MALVLSIEDTRTGGFITEVTLTDEQVTFLEMLEYERKDIALSDAEAAQWAIEQAREAWNAEGEQDGPGE